MPHYMFSLNLYSRKLEKAGSQESICFCNFYYFLPQSNELLPIVTVFLSLFLHLLLFIILYLLTFYYIPGNILGIFHVLPHLTLTIVLEVKCMHIS